MEVYCILLCKCSPMSMQPLKQRLFVAFSSLFLYKIRTKLMQVMHPTIRWRSTLLHVNIHLI